VLIRLVFAASQGALSEEARQLPVTDAEIFWLGAVTSLLAGLGTSVGALGARMRISRRSRCSAASS
jgi:hypothetical protein